MQTANGNRVIHPQAELSVLQIRFFKPHYTENKKPCHPCCAQKL